MKVTDYNSPPVYALDSTADIEKMLHLAWEWGRLYKEGKARTISTLNLDLFSTSMSTSYTLCKCIFENMITPILSNALSDMGAESSVVNSVLGCLQVKPNSARKWSKVVGKSHIHCPLGRKRCEYYLPLDDEFVEKIPHVYDTQEGGENSPWFLWDQPAEELVSDSVRALQRKKQYYAVNRFFRRMVEHWVKCHEDYTMPQSLQDFSEGFGG